MSDGQGGSNGESGTDEPHSQRVNRELIELLNELRVALPGVQVLFRVPLGGAVRAGICADERLPARPVLRHPARDRHLVGAPDRPSAYHRINFREHDKERMLLTSNNFAIAGLVFLALAIVGAVALIADFLYGPASRSSAPASARSCSGPVVRAADRPAQPRAHAGLSRWPTRPRVTSSSLPRRRVVERG